MKKTLTELALEIKKSNKNIAKAKQDIINEKAESHKKYILEEFEIAFAEQLELLREEGISWTAKMRDNKYIHQGSYIQFERKIRNEKGELLTSKYLRMEFHNRNQYRYEFISNDSSYGTMAYGKWNMNEFIEFIYDNLIAES